jgi:hypothetical protein
MKTLLPVLVVGMSALAVTAASAAEDMHFSQAMTIAAREILPPLPARFKGITCSPATGKSYERAYACDVAMGGAEYGLTSREIAEGLPSALVDKARAADFRFRILPDVTKNMRTYTVELAVDRHKMSLPDAVTFLEAFKADFPRWMEHAQTAWNTAPARQAQERKDVESTNFQSWNND